MMVAIGLASFFASLLTGFFGGVFITMSMQHFSAWNNSRSLKRQRAFRNEAIILFCVFIVLIMTSVVCACSGRLFRHPR